MLILAASAVMDWIGGPDEANAGGEFSIRCQASNAGDVACYLHIKLYDADTHELLYDYGKFGLIDPGSTLNPFPGTWPTEKLVTMPAHDLNLLAIVYVNDRTVPDDALTKTIYIPTVRFADVAISRRYGDRLYLSGKLKNIITSDEICIKVFRPEDGTVHNLPSATRDYTYLKDASGTYTFPDDACIPIWDDKFVSGHWEGNDYVMAHYEDTWLPGLYYLIVYDVSGTCEAVGEERCRAAVLVIEPRYQYQVEFKTANLDSPEAVTMLEARRRQWARVTDKRVEPYGSDCFSVRLKYSSGWDDVTGLVWLCSAYQARTKAKFMPLPPIGNLEFTEYLEYFRAECDCAEFQESRKYGVPCVHIMAAYYHLDRKPPYCEYIKCP